MLRRARILWRSARNVSWLRRILESGDRIWWARTIRRAHLVDVELIAAQGHRGSARAAIRRYVRGGFRDGFALNPLLMERLVASQLSDVGRVPALYAYLVNDARRIETSVNWDSRGYSRTRGALDAPGGPLGHAWREAARSGEMQLYGASIRWSDFTRAVAEGARQSAGAPVPDLQPLRSSTVFVCRIADREDAADALRLAASFAARGLPVVIALAGEDADQWISATQLRLRFPDVQLTRDGADLVERVRRAAPDSVILVRGPSAEISERDLLALERTADGGRTAGPVWLDSDDGTIVSAGVGIRGGIGFDVLRGHPPEDVAELDDLIVVAEVRGDTIAIPRQVTGPPTILTRAIVRAPARGGPTVDPSHQDTAIEALLAPTSFSIEGWAPDGPTLVRSRRVVRLEEGVEVPSFRWAIKIAAPPGPRGEWWGDTHFARGIASALRRLGQEVVIDAYAARDRPTSVHDDVTLALRGPEPIHAGADSRSILWIISHPDEIGQRDLDGYDAVFAASAMWADAASRRFHREIRPLLQCTDARQFHPRGSERSEGLVFVGTARGIARPSIIEPLKAGVPVAVYGPDWSGWIPGGAIRGSGIPNADLPAFYESAGAVLNDHWPAMRASGFVSNRLYDVVASGGRVISDDVVGIADIFGGAVRTYRDIPELLRLVTQDLDELFPPDAELAGISERVRREHSFDARARTLLEAAIRL